ncbi:hypothetical protein [Paraburkholderia monticola]|uniref:hypothetical protein n=1 Tax=Paraburkholderia monticola TaxID=1399968 RepID=UPI001F4D1674|nr:hypothetical protein [Paraburkholderia monticola]
MMAFVYEVKIRQRLSLVMYSCGRINYTASHAGINPGSNHGFNEQGFSDNRNGRVERHSARRGGDEHRDADVGHDRLARRVVAAKPV